MGDALFTLREANRLFRDGDLSMAMQMYLQLHEQRPLQMYADNALLAARRLGLGKFGSVEALREGGACVRILVVGGASGLLPLSSDKGPRLIG